MNPKLSKQEQLLELARKRQRARWDGYACIGDAHGGIYECDYVSPYTKSANNVDASVMVLLQDWSSDSRIINGPFDQGSLDYGHTPKFPTTRNLINLLNRTFGLRLQETYATNLFPFIKLGGISSRIYHRDLIRAAQEFAIPQIEIVAPKLVICLGLATFNAVRVASNSKNSKALSNLDVALANPFFISNSAVWGQAHTGARGQNTRNRKNRNQTSADWQLMRQVVAKDVTNRQGTETDSV